MSCDEARKCVLARKDYGVFGLVVLVRVVEPATEAQDTFLVDDWTTILERKFLR